MNENQAFSAKIYFLLSLIYNEIIDSTGAYIALFFFALKHHYASNFSANDSVLAELLDGSLH
jgi:hypothetical protein